MSEASTTTLWVNGEAIIQDPTGLHARPAVKLTKLAKEYSSEIEVRANDQSDWINGKSTNKVMKLKIPHGQPLYIRASGSDAEIALKSLIELINRDFND